MGKIKEKFEELVKEFTFEQFYELCKIFDVDVVDRSSVKEITLEATKNNEKMDFSKVKMRRDFDVMTQELVESYYRHNRGFRRQADQIIGKVVKANRTAKKLQDKYLVKQYNEGIANLESVQEMHLENMKEKNTQEVSTEYNISNTDKLADMAAIATED